MGLWKITDKGPSVVKQTKFKQENLLEEHLEEWIATDPTLLGEPLMVFGRQVMVPDTKDRLDLLALDPQGSIVIIELKRGHLKDPVDMQSLRYASYVSKWRFQDFENIARNYFGKVGDLQFNFNEMFESFCSESGVDDIPDINNEQRIMIVGSAVREKLGSVALWLREHRIDITLIEVKAFKERDDLFIEPIIIVPVPVSRFASVGKQGTDGQPWITDGKTWHLEKRCSPKTKEMLLSLDQIIQDEFDIDGPRWSQKGYVAYRVNNYNWLCVNTHPSCLVLAIRVKSGKFKTIGLAKKLGIEAFDTDVSMTEKLGLSSSVFVKNRNSTSDRIILRAKEDFEFASESFVAFLKEAHKTFPK